MADIQANIGIGVDTSQALAAIRQLQREISAFHTSMAKGGALANAESMRMQQNLINTINATGQFSAGMSKISSSTESFTNALEKNKLSMGQYFRYAGGASSTFGKMFSKEFSTINRVATERVKDLQTQYISMGRDANGALQSIKVRPLALDMDHLGTRVQLTAQKQQLFNQLMKQGSTNLLNFGKNTQWAGRQLMVGFTIPLTILGTAAAREFQKLEEQAIKFRRVYGDMFTTTTDTEKALSDIRALADEFTKYGVAVEKTLGLAAEVAQMGGVGAALTAQVTQATRLAVLGGIEQEEALNTTISLTSAFGVATEDLAGKIAFLNAVENQTILSIEDFNEAIPKAGAVVKQLGGDVEDLAFFLTAMREGGINASESANALKSGLASIINPTQQSIDKMKEFGIDVVGIVDSNAGNLKNTVMGLATALNGLGDLDRARAIEQLFGKFQFARISTLFQNITKDGTQAQQVLKLTANSTAELAIIAERELSKVEDSVATKFTKQMESLQAALAPIGEEFMKAVIPVLEFGTKLLKSFNNLGDGSKQFIVILTAVAGVVAPAALMAFGLVANGVANLIKLFAFLGRGFGALSGQSTLLGTGTEYMTQQQLEAAAVAASLGQSHQNLIQVFGVETSAVNNLANAYRQATIAQSAFRGTGAAAAGARIPKPKGYATGGKIVGPGTGTSDSIFIQASNGEFVVNAKATAENLALLEAINGGKAPKFAEGGTVGPSFSNSATAQKVSDLRAELGDDVDLLETVLQKLAKTVDDGAQVVEASYKEIKKKVTEEAMRQGKENKALAGTKTVKAHVQGTHEPGSAAYSRAMESSGIAQANLPPEVMNRLSVVGNLTAELPAALNQGLIKGVDKGLFSDVWNAKKGKMSAAFEAGGLDYSDSSNAQAAQEFEDDLGQKAMELAQARAEAAGSTDAVTVSDKDLAQATQELVKKYRARGGAHENVANAAQDRMDSVGGMRAELGSSTVRKYMAERADGRAGFARSSGNELVWQDPNDPNVNIKGMARGGAGNSWSGSGIKVKTEKGYKGYKIKGVRNADAYNDGVESIAKDIKDIASEKAGRGSPHPEAFPDGVDDAKDYLRGQESVLGPNSDPYAGSNLAAPKPPTSPAASSKAGGFLSSVKGKAVNVGNRAMDMALTTGPGKKMANYFAETSGGNITNSKGEVVSDFHQKTGAPGNIAGGIIPVRIVDDVTFHPDLEDALENGGAQTEDLSESMRGVQQSTDRNTNATKEERRAAARQRRAGIAGKAFAGLGTATMIAGMATQVEGKVGETAQQLVGPLAAISGIAPVLMAMGPLWGTLLAVIGGGVALWMLHNKALKEARNNAFELGRAMGTGTEAIQKFAEFAGRVASPELASAQREQRQSLLQLQPGTKTFGSAFIEGEDGQAMVENTRKAIEQFGRDGTIQKTYMQLGTAILQGALSQPEAISIASALGQEIGDMSLGMSVSGDLIALLGPNGENLLEDPLKIQSLLLGETVGANTQSLENAISRMEILKPQVEILGGGGNEARLFTDEADKIIATEKQRQLDEAVSFSEKFMVFIKMQSEIAAELRATASGEAMAIYVNSLETSANAIDAQRVATNKAIDEAIANGATQQEINDLKEEEAAAIASLNEELSVANQALTKWWSELPKGERSTAIKDQNARIVAAAEAQGLTGKDVGTDLINLEDVGEGSEYNMVIRTAVESGALTLEQLSFIVDTMNTEDEKQIVASLITKVGGETSNLMNVLALIKDEDIRATVTASFKTLDEGQTLEKIEDLDALYRGSEIFDGIDIPVRFLTNSEDENALKNTMDLANEVRTLGSQGGLLKDGELDVAAYGAIVGEDVANRAAAVADALGEQFDVLSEAEKLEFFSQFAIHVQFTGDEEAITFLKSQGMEMGLKTGTAAQRDVVLGQQIRNVLPQMTPLAAPGESEKPLDSGSGGAGPQIDSLIKKLRDLRIATIDMKKGWEGMQQVLEKVFAGGSKGIDVFDGLSNQIRRMGVGESLIEMIVGMDPDEYQKRKNELFVFDKAGNIVGTTAKLKNMNAAFNAIAIGEYINSQQQFIQNTNHQFTAMNMLTAQGLSFVEAYEMVQDQALATAIAMGATRAEIEKLISITRQMAGVREQYNKISAEEQAAKSVRETNKEFADRVAILQKLSKSSGQYSDEQINAILNDSNLGKLFLNPQIDPKALERALKNAEQQANLDLQIAISTKEGLEQKFNELNSEISDEFSRQENKINIDFELATDSDQDIVRDAQNKIAAIQFEIDDYEAQLRGIGDQEDAINDKYDDRFEALEKVAKANERIAASQKAQLNIADALSRGDIAAAAQAQQEFRAQQAQAAAESQKEKLEKQKEAELKNIRSASGMSREQLEELIKSRQDDIFNIEESELETAQERIRIAEYNRDVQIDALEVSGKTREEWEKIASQVDIATTNIEEFNLSVARALAIYENLVNGVALPEELFPTPEAPAPSSGGGGGGGGGGGAPVAASAGGGGGGGTTQTAGQAALSSLGVNPNIAGSISRAGQSAISSLGSNPSARPATAQIIRATTNSALASLGVRPTVTTTNPSRRPTTIASGGMVIPKRMNVGGVVKGYAAGGLSMGSDIVPALLTPGEFVIRRPAVMGFGKDKLEQINKGTYSGGSMYNYNLVVNVKSDANPDKIAQTVIQQIKRVDSQRVKGNRF